MTILNWSSLSIVLMLTSLAAFSWGMRKFFYKPAGDSPGMKVIRACGTSFAVLHCVAMAATPEATARQALAAASLYVGSLMLFYWAIRTHGQRFLSAAFSPDSPNHLVDSGPYRYIRHPFYTSYLATWVAGYVATGRWWLLPTIAVMVYVYHRAAKMEEGKFASSPLAEAYRDYQQSTGRFLPNPLVLTRGRKRETGEASIA